MGERMSKQILGDNPFEDDDEPAEEHAEDERAPTEDSAAARSEGAGTEARESEDAGREADETDGGKAHEAAAGGGAPEPEGSPDAAAETEPAERDAAADQAEASGAGERSARPNEADGTQGPGDHERPGQAPKDGSAQPNGQIRAPDAALPDSLPVDTPFAADDAHDVVLGGEASVPPGDYGPPIHSVLPNQSSITSEIRELERRVRARLTPAFPIEEPRRLPLEFIWKRYRRLAMRGRSDVVDDYGRDPIYTSRIEPVLDLLTRHYFRLETTGIEHVPETGRAILVANHAGPLPYDAAVLMHLIRQEHPAHRDLRPLVEDSAYHAPYLGKLLSRIGAVRACQQNAMRLLEDDELVAVFPEGNQGSGKLFKDRYRLQRFGRGGFIKLALRARAPVVPVAIVGAEETQPVLHRFKWLSATLGFPNIPVTPTFPWLGPLGLLPLPAKWRIRFGEPLDLAGEYDPEAAGDRLLVNKLADGVRSQIQGMLDASRSGGASGGKPATSG